MKLNIADQKMDYAIKEFFAPMKAHVKTGQHWWRCRQIKYPEC